MAESVKHFIRHFGLDTMKPGDAYITNDPWMGTGIPMIRHHEHLLPQWQARRPVLLHEPSDGYRRHRFRAGRDRRLHGRALHSLPESYSRKVAPTRRCSPMIRAKHAIAYRHHRRRLFAHRCNDVGCRRLVEMMGNSSWTISICSPRTSSRSRGRAVMAEIARLPKGSWSNTMVTDGYDEPITLSATMTISDQGIHVDTRARAPGQGAGSTCRSLYDAYTVFGLGCVVASKSPTTQAR